MTDNNHKLRIMIIEDDPLLKQLYVNILTERSYDIVATASNGVEAIEVFNKISLKPNLIILDYKLPLLNGLEVTKKLQEQNSDINIFMITGDNTLDSKFVLSQGIILRRKPIQLNEILEVLEEIRKS